MKTFLNFFFVLFISMQLQAQERLISGTITDETGIGLPGANVNIKGTSVGTTANFDGYYQLKAKDTDILVFSYIGFKSTEKMVGKLTTISLALQPDSATLEEVVVVGYG